MKYRLASDRDPIAVTVTLLSEAGKPVGLVELPDDQNSEPTGNSWGVMKEVTPSGAPAPDVLRYAEAKAAQLGCEVVLIDPNGLRPTGA